MKTIYLKQKVLIRDIEKGDQKGVINLLKKVYGSAYYYKQFYKENVIARYIQDAIHKERRKVYWKVAAHKKKIIGQMMFVIKHGAGFFIFTMVDPDYEGENVITSISAEIIKILNEMNQNDMRCIYAFADAANMPIKKVLISYKFKVLGRLPNFRGEGEIKVYGKLVYDFHWRMINPHIKLSPLIYKTVRDAKIPRIVLANGMASQNSEGIEATEFQVSQERDSKRCAIKTEDGDICARYIEEVNNHIWRDFMITDELSFTTKKHLIRFIHGEFQQRSEINGISFAIDSEDVESQWLVLNKGGQYGAFLPFYLGEKDAVLLYIKKGKEVQN